ncbi:MAG: DUF3105 domain-containing protein [Actinomycetota bacterium]
MTRVSPSSKSPNKQATIKQQRAARRDEKLAKFRAREKRRIRMRRIGISSAIVAAVAVVAVIVGSIVLAPRPVEYTAGSAGVKIAGVAKFTNSAQHVTGSVTYPQTPPAGGNHSQILLNCGLYSKPVPNENAVHDLEHGAVWVTYDPTLSSSQLQKLRSFLPSSQVVLSPYPGLTSKVVLSAWNVQLKLSSVTDKRIAAFFEEYWNGSQAPESGAACSGGIDGPGKL